MANIFWPASRGEPLYRYASVHVPEQKLSIEITDVYGVHVDHMDVLEPSKRQVCKNFASKTASPDN